MDQECLIRPCFDIHTGLCLTRQCQLSRGRVDADATGEATFLLVLLAHVIKIEAMLRTCSVCFQACNR